ncbi:hypothetical protein [Okeania sp. SIO2C2]|nr:hypothetical protein [Okeania sp. SIO2C2]
MIVYQFDKYLLQIARIFLRSQPTPAPPRRGTRRGSQEDRVTRE